MPRCPALPPHCPAPSREQPQLLRGIWWSWGSSVDKPIGGSLGWGRKGLLATDLQPSTSSQKEASPGARATGKDPLPLLGTLQPRLHLPCHSSPLGRAYTVTGDSPACLEPGSAEGPFLPLGCRRPVMAALSLSGDTG